MDKEKFVLDKKIGDKLLENELTPMISGFRYLHDMIQLTLENGCIVTNMQPYYKIVGDKYKVSKRTIERGIKYATDKIGNKTPKEIIMQMALEISAKG